MYICTLPISIRLRPLTSSSSRWTSEAQVLQPGDIEAASLPFKPWSHEPGGGRIWNSHVATALMNADAAVPAFQRL